MFSSVYNNHEKKVEVSLEMELFKTEVVILQIVEKLNFKELNNFLKAFPQLGNINGVKVLLDKHSKKEAEKILKKYRVFKERKTLKECCKCGKYFPGDGGKCGLC